MKKRTEESIVSYYGALAIYQDDNKVLYLGIENQCATSLKVVPESLVKSLVKNLNFGKWEETTEAWEVITPEMELAEKAKWEAIRDKRKQQGL